MRSQVIIKGWLTRRSSPGRVKSCADEQRQQRAGTMLSGMAAAGYQDRGLAAMRWFGWRQAPRIDHPTRVEVRQVVPLALPCDLRGRRIRDHGGKGAIVGAGGERQGPPDR